MQIQSRRSCSSVDVNHTALAASDNACTKAAAWAWFMHGKSVENMEGSRPTNSSSRRSSSGAQVSESRFKAEAELAAAASILKENMATSSPRLRPAATISSSMNGIWNCESKLYDAFELQELEQRLDRNLERPQEDQRRLCHALDPDVPLQKLSNVRSMSMPHFPANSTTRPRSKDDSRARNSSLSRKKSSFASSLRGFLSVFTRKSVRDKSSEESRKQESQAKDQQNIQHHYHHHHYYHHHHIVHAGNRFEEIAWSPSPEDEVPELDDAWDATQLGWETTLPVVPQLEWKNQLPLRDQDKRLIYGQFNFLEPESSWLDSSSVATSCITVQQTEVAYSKASSREELWLPSSVASAQAKLSQQYGPKHQRAHSMFVSQVPKNHLKPGHGAHTYMDI